MANFYITHHFYPDNPQFFTINISQVVKIEGEPDTDFHEDHRGEHYWEISIYTTAIDVSGESLDASWIDEFEDEDAIDVAVAGKLEYICSLIDWSSAGEFDEQMSTNVPFISSQSPASNETDVVIWSTMRVVIKENLPSSGLDIDTLVFKVKGIEVSPTVVGNPYEYVVTYSPQRL